MTRQHGLQARPQIASDPDRAVGGSVRSADRNSVPNRLVREADHADEGGPSANIGPQRARQLPRLPSGLAVAEISVVTRFCRGCRCSRQCGSWRRRGDSRLRPAGHVCVDVAADEQDRRRSFILRDFREIGFDVRVVDGQQLQAGGTQDVLGFLVHDRRGFELGDEFFDSGLVGDEGEVVAGGGVVVVVGSGFSS